MDISYCSTSSCIKLWLHNNCFGTNNNRLRNIYAWYTIKSLARIPRFQQRMFIVHRNMWRQNNNRQRSDTFVCVVFFLSPSMFTIYASILQIRTNTHTQRTVLAALYIFGYMLTSSVRNRMYFITLSLSDTSLQFQQNDGTVSDVYY